VLGVGMLPDNCVYDVFELGIMFAVYVCNLCFTIRNLLLGV